MFRPSMSSKHAEYTSPTANIKHHFAFEQVLVVVYSIAIGQSSDLVLEHFLMNSWSVTQTLGQVHNW